MERQTILQLQQSVQNGDAFAMTLFGLLLADGQLGEDAMSDGMQMIEYAAESKNVIWAKCLWRYVRSSREIVHPIALHATVDDDAISQLQIYAEEGNMWAQAVLGNMYYMKECTGEERETANCLICRSSEMGCLFAMELMKAYQINNTKYVASSILERFKNKDKSKYWLK